MELATTTQGTGPGGTELIARPEAKRQSAKAKQRTPATRDETAHFLRQDLELARREGSPEKIEAARQKRIQFWMDTCREAVQMQAASKQVLELHRQHGCRFCPPSVGQVKHILEALDAALPDWEREHAALFYRTLELNFPELLRFCRVQRGR